MCPAAHVAAGLVLLASWCAGADEAAPGWLEANEVQHRSRLAELHYYEGEAVNVMCWRRLPASNVSVQLSYYSYETDTVSTEFQTQNSVEMYLKLRAAHNDTIITCTIKDDSNDEYIIQLHLLLRPLAYTLGFEVNGLQVRPRAGRPAGGVLYQYRYLRDERMTVRLVKDPREHGAARCDVTGKDIPASWLNHVNSAELLSSGEGVHLVNSSLPPQQSGATVSCRVQRRVGPELVLALTFTYYELVPYVGGLTMANVELLYVTNITFVLYGNHAPYAGNDTHYLTFDAINGVSELVHARQLMQIYLQKNGEGGPYVSVRMFDDIEWSRIRYEREPGEGPGRQVHLWLHRATPRPQPRPRLLWRGEWVLLHRRCTSAAVAFDPHCAPSDSAPSTTDSAPSITDWAPSITDWAPSITDWAPSTTDSAPSTTDSAPSTTDSALSTMDSSPSTTDSASSTSDSAPSTTDSAPSTTDSAP